MASPRLGDYSYYWNTFHALEKCGPAAGPYLLTLLATSESQPARHWFLRSACADLLGRTRSVASVPYLVRALQEASRHHRARMAQPGWTKALAWKDRIGRYNLGFVCAVIAALGRLEDRKALPALKAALKLWAPSDDDSVVPSCRRAIATIERSGPR